MFGMSPERQHSTASDRDCAHRTGRFEAGVPDLLDRGWENGGTVYIDYDDREP
jgi:hypothetical protein